MTGQCFSSKQVQSGRIAFIVCASLAVSSLTTLLHSSEVGGVPWHTGAPWFRICCIHLAIPGQAVWMLAEIERHHFVRLLRILVPFEEGLKGCICIVLQADCPGRSQSIDQVPGSGCR